MFQPPLGFQVSRSLRSLPYVDPSLPTLALVGAPNVGKSSLVRVLSSGVPEVCNYPFTTRSIKMGHFYIDAKRHQVSRCMVQLLADMLALCQG